MRNVKKSNKEVIASSDNVLMVVKIRRHHFCGPHEMVVSSKDWIKACPRCGTSILDEGDGFGAWYEKKGC